MSRSSPQKAGGPPAACLPACQTASPNTRESHRRLAPHPLSLSLNSPPNPPLLRADLKCPSVIHGVLFPSRCWPQCQHLLLQAEAAAGPGQRPAQGTRLTAPGQRVDLERAASGREIFLWCFPASPPQSCRLGSHSALPQEAPSSFTPALIALGCHRLGTSPRPPLDGESRPPLGSQPGTGRAQSGSREK